MSSHEKKGPRHALNIVEDVLDLPPGDRSGALLRACGDDAELLEEALSLLWASLEVSDVETPAFAPVRGAGGESGGHGAGDREGEPGRRAAETRGAAEPEKPGAAESADGAVGGSAIGPFQILRELGHGGMGTVYLAEQSAPIRRRVAVKVAREWLDEGARLRLAAERQAMARLSHENVARLYEAGATDAGHPYFAMEYVEGETLTAYCDSQRLGVDERLRLFLDVCAGVEHAHRHGIIHRDLKPSNILVAEGDGGPRPKVIDFGIAKATDGRLHEKSLMTGQSIVGTPAYLSPESIADPDAVDTRSDVYSLGVLLQELLIGVRLVPEKAGESAISLLRRVLEEEPPPMLRRWRRLDPETRRRTRESRGLAGGDLEPKIRGDLEWIVGRATAKGMDERYSSVAELAADVKRHLEHQPVLAGPPDTLYQLRKLVRRHRGPFAFSLLVLLSLVGGFVARTLEAERARGAAAEAIRAREETEEVVTYLTNLFVSADPYESLGDDPTATELLERGVRRLEGDAFDGRPAIRARLLHTTARVLWRLGRARTSRPLAEEALEIRGRLSTDSVELAESLAFVGVLAGEADDHGRAEQLLRRALALREAKSDSRELASVLLDLAAILEESGQAEVGLPYARRALGIVEAEFGPRDRRVSGVLNNLGTLSDQAGRVDEAEQAYRRAIEIKRETLPRGHPSLAPTLVNLGNLLAFHRREGAVELFREARAIEEKALGPDHPDLALTLNSLGTELRKEGDWIAAREAFDRALAILEKSRGREHAHVAMVLSNLGGLEHARGDHGAATDRARRALEIREKNGSESAVTSSLLKLAKIERLAGDASAAAPLLQRAEELLAGQKNASARLFLAAELGWLALLAGDPVKAEAYFREATDGEAPENERAAEARGEAWKGRARLALDRGASDEAASAVRRSLDALETIFAPTHVSVVEARALAEEISRGS
ncbi:MAG: serine/threonine-protein kinase [Acidobacteriota bacterium]